MVAVVDLPDVSLDFYVALAEGRDVKLLRDSMLWVLDNDCLELFCPSRMEELANPIIDREKIKVWQIGRQLWMAESCSGHIQAAGRTALLAAMRTYIIDTFGNNVRRPPFMLCRTPLRRKVPAGLPPVVCNAPDAWL